MSEEAGEGVDTRVLREGLAALYDKAPCGYLVSRPDGTVLHANQTLRAWLAHGDPGASAPGHFQDLLTIPGRLLYENQYAPLLHLQGFVNAVSFDLKRGTHAPLPVLVTSVLHASDGATPDLVASIILDATDRRAYERELLLARRRAEQLAAIVTESGDAILSLAPDGAVRTWNGGAERLLERPAAAVIGQNFWAFLRPVATAESVAAIVAALRAGEVVRLEAMIALGESREAAVMLALTPHFGPFDEFASFSAIVTDIGARKAVERQQRDFLALVTHELRTPLAAIRGYAELMQRRQSYNEAGTATILAQAGRLDRLISELLDVSGADAGQFVLRRERGDLVGLLRAGAAASAQSASVHFIGPDHPLEGHWDRDRLEQVLQNLLTNARKYAPEGREIVVRVVDRGDEAHVAVEDRGPGIAPEALPRLFERFYRTASARTSRAEGLGLGLYICRTIIEAHGGRIWADSTPGLGSTFTFALPYAP